MSVAAVIWAHEEPEVLLPNLRYLLAQVDGIVLRLRDTGEETRQAISELQADAGEQLILQVDDGKFGFKQAAIMTSLARSAGKMGFSWVVPIDPDEVWYANGATLSTYLGGMSRDVGIVQAELYNHVATSRDPEEGTPFQRLGWRQVNPLPLPKVAVRAHPTVRIAGGNHSATITGIPLTIGPALVVRHFPYRTADQFVERVRTNYANLKASGLPRSFGTHVWHYGECLENEGEEVLREHFRTWFMVEEPEADDTLIYDPAPMGATAPGG